MRRLVTFTMVVVATTAALGAIAPASNAALPVRLQGRHSTKVRVTKQVYIAGAPRTTGTRIWRFAPACRSGTCTTVLKRRSIESKTVFSENLVPQPNGNYSLIATGRADCFNVKTGALIRKKAYDTSLKIVLTPTHIRHGRVSAYKGTIAMVDNPRPSAPSTCPKAVQDSVFSTT